MVRVWAFVIALVVALGFAAWASDFVTMQGERTVYTVDCADGSWQGDRCSGRVKAGTRYRYRALKPHNEVIFWTVGTNEPSGKFNDCKIEDGRNWACKVCADAARSITLADGARQARAGGGCEQFGDEAVSRRLQVALAAAPARLHRGPAGAAGLGADDDLSAAPARQHTRRKGGAEEDHGTADDHRHRQPLAEEQAAPQHREQRDQIRHRDRVRGPGVGDQAKVEDVGDAGAEDREQRGGDPGVQRRRDPPATRAGREAPARRPRRAGFRLRRRAAARRRGDVW